MKKYNTLNHKNRTIFVRTALGLTSFFTFGQMAQGAITITLSGKPDATSALASLEGSLILLDTTTTPTSSTRLPVPLTGGSFGILGFGASFGRPSTTAFATSQNNDLLERGLGIDTASFSITDSSNSGSIIAMNSVENITYSTNGSYSLNIPLSSFSDTIDEGDILMVSGNFDLSLASGTFGSRFNPGVHTGIYNGQAVNLVVNTVPEPSPTLLGLLGSLFSLCLLRRRSPVF